MPRAIWIGRSTKATLAELPSNFAVGSELAVLASVHRDLTALMPDLTRLGQIVSERSELTFNNATRVLRHRGARYHHSAT